MVAWPSVSEDTQPRSGARTKRQSSCRDAPLVAPNLSKRRTTSTPHIPHTTPYALQATPHTHTRTHSWSRVIMSSNSPFALSIKPLFYIHPKSTAILRISKYRSETNHLLVRVEVPVMQGLLLLLCCFSAPRVILSVSILHRR